MKVLILLLAVVFSASGYTVRHQLLTIPSDESAFDEDDLRDRRLINANNATGK
jgi:hypothetical protein